MGSCFERGVLGTTRERPLPPLAGNAGRRTQAQQRHTELLLATQNAVTARDAQEPRLVELDKGEHDSVVDVGGERLAEGVRGEPRDRLPEDLRLEVDALDGDEGLPQGVRAGDVGLEFESEAAGSLAALGRDAVHPLGGEDGEEPEHREGVVEVAEGVLRMGEGAGVSAAGGLEVGSRAAPQNRRL